MIPVLRQSIISRPLGRAKLTDNDKTKKHRTRSTGLESTARTHEQTSTDRTTTEIMVSQDGAL